MWHTIVVWNIVNRASTEEHKTVLNEELNNKCIENDLFLCDDFNCNDRNHQQNIDVLCQDIISSMLIATYKCIPCKTKSRCRRCIPGWKELILLLLYVINQSFGGKYGETLNNPKMALLLL